MLQYVSFLTPIASSGDIVIDIETFDANTNVSFSINSSASAGYTEQQAAILLYDTASTYIYTNDLVFGEPVFYNEAPAATFRVTRTEHCVCFFSESQFELNVSSNPTGSIIQVSDYPTLTTVSECRNAAAASLVSLANAAGEDLSDAALANMVMYASTEFCAVTNNPIVISSYIYEEITNFNQSIFLPMLPLVTVDRPHIRRPGFPQLFIATADLATNYSADRQSGEVNFRFAQDMLFIYEPFDMHNDYKQYYTAGYKYIPKMVKLCTTRFVNNLAIDSVKTLQAGTFRVDQLRRYQFLQDLLGSCEKFFLPGMLA